MLMTFGRSSVAACVLCFSMPPMVIFLRLMWPIWRTASTPANLVGSGKNSPTETCCDRGHHNERGAECHWKNVCIRVSICTVISSIPEAKSGSH